jgi:hypothetical protein
MTNGILYYFLTACLSVITFFLIRFYYLVDELRKDIKDLLINESSRTTALENMKDDLIDVKQTVHDHDKKLNSLELQIAKIQK